MSRITPSKSNGSATSHLGAAPRQARHRRAEEPSTSIWDDPGPSDYADRREKDKKTMRRGRKRWDLAGKGGKVREAFRQFGEHCARNQIRTLLIDCLVMTNLFYPSLAIYLSKKFPPLHPPSPPSHNTHRIPGGPRPKKEHPLSLLSTPVLDSFFPYPPPLLPRLTWAGWWGRGQGSPEDDIWGVTRIGGLEDDLRRGWEEEVRIVRVGWAAVGDVLDRDLDMDAKEREWLERDHVLLRLVRDVSESWAEEYSRTREGCVRQLAPSPSDGTIGPYGECYILSPSHTPPSISNLTSLVSLESAHDAADETEPPDIVPVGWTANAGDIYHSVAALFRVPRQSAADFERRWAERVIRAAKEVDGEVFVEAQGSRGGAGDQTGEWMLSWRAQEMPSQDDDSDAQPPRSALSPTFISLFYLCLFVTLAAQLSNASKVHSRFGLAFTGIVQLCCSAVMSFSVLALLGWNGWGYSRAESSLPTYILPFVIVVVGAENMATLTKAVFSVPFTYSVPVRIGLGLSKVGTKIALTSLTDLLLLGLVWLFVNLKPVREFCLFAAVVIITDWFMLHTFFLTVLSIDAQRLELADVLASNGAMAVDKPKVRGEDEKFEWRKFFKARTTKSGSLYLLLICVGIIYYFTERHISPHTTASLYGYQPSATTPSPSPNTGKPFVTSLLGLASLSPAQKLWRALNPSNLANIRITVPAASIVVLPQSGHSTAPADIRKLTVPTTRLLLPRLKPLFYLFKVVILPQAVTAGALYILLLYLLKDTELLDAQRNKLGRGEVRPSEDDTDTSAKAKDATGLVMSKLSANILPCSHQADVDVLASSGDGRVVLSVGMDDALCLWRFDGGEENGRGTRETLRAKGSNGSGGEGVVAACVSTNGQWVAVGYQGGSVHIWEIPDEGVPIPCEPLSLSNNEEKMERMISKMRFEEKHDTTEDPFMTRSDSSSSPQHNRPSLLVLCRGGEVIELSGGVISVLIQPEKAKRVMLLDSVQQSTSFIVASLDSTVLWQRYTSGWTTMPLPITISFDDRITCASWSAIVVRGVHVSFIGVGHRSGMIEVFDSIGNPVATIAPGSKPSAVVTVSFASPQAIKCSGCGTTTSEGFFVVSSNSTHVHIDLVLPKSATFCRCPARRPNGLDDASLSPQQTLRLRTSTNSLVVPPSASRSASSPVGSPRKSPSLLPPVSNGEFPLSSHGGARRLSNMYGTRDESDSSGSISRERGGRPPSPMPDKGLPNLRGTSPSGLASHAGEYDVHPLGAVLCPGGVEASFAILHGEVVAGMRRNGAGIDDSRWFLWVVDLPSAWNGSTLNVDSSSFEGVARRTSARLRTTNTGQSARPLGEVSMKERRAERLRSLSGRTAFPPLASSGMGSFGASGSGSGSGMGTFDAMAYVEVKPWLGLGEGAVLLGLGNRMGVVSLPASWRGGRDTGMIGGRRSEEGVGVGKRMAMGLGLTPPPPTTKRTYSDEGAKKVQ